MKTPRPVVRRSMAAAVAVAAASFGLAACGSDESDGSASANSSSGPIRALLNAQPSSLDPIVAPRSGQVVWATMVEPLITTNEDLEPSADGLLTDWERTDPTTWTFTLREGVMFSNGEAADAEAVVNTLELSRDSEGSILKSYFGNVASVEAPDATTVVVKTGTPQYDIPNLLTTVYLVPPDYYEAEGSEGFAVAPVGTGPYVLDEFQAGRSISVEVNPDYWGEAPDNTGVVFTWATEAAQRLALLQSDSVDVSFDLPPAQAMAAQDAGLEVVSTESAIKILAFLQSTTAPFDDPQLREAAALAIDRDAIVEGIFDGQAVADGGLLNVKPGTDPAEQVEADPDAAAAIGGGGATVPISYPPSQYTNVEEVARAIGGSLEQAGFKVEYNPLDYGTLVGQVVGRQLNGLYIFAGVPNVAVPDFFASGFMKSASITGNCPDPQIDELVAEALEQEDAESAAPVYEELNTLGVVEKHCYVPLYKQIYHYGLADGVDGVVYSPLNAVDFTGATS